jgi:hypothetical protein
VRCRCCRDVYWTWARALEAYNAADSDAVQTNLSSESERGLTMRLMAKLLPMARCQLQARLAATVWTTSGEC